MSCVMKKTKTKKQQKNKKKTKKKKQTKTNNISNMRAVQTHISRHIAIITSNQALLHLEWYGTKWVTV